MSLRLTALLLSQRYLAPLITFLGASAIFCTGATGPILPTYAIIAAVVLATSTWSTIILVNLEGPVSHDVALVGSGGSRARAVAASALLAAAIGVLLTVLGTLLPLLSSDRATWWQVRDGALASLSGGLTGVAVGLVCSRLVIGRIGYTVIAASLLAFALLRLDVPPVGHLLRQLSATPPPAGLEVPLIADVMIAVVLVTASVAAATYASDRSS
jgi:hypothetical protein